MHLVCDCHIHTLSSGHAYSTIGECAKAAAEKGIELIAMTDHAPAMPGGTHVFHFDNLRVLPEFLNGVRLLKGAEVNILDFDGLLDLNDRTLGGLDLIIASLHVPCFQAGSPAENTRAAIGAMQSSFVDILGHPDDSRIPLDYDELARAAAATGTLLELNNSSLSPLSFRQNAQENCVRLIEAALRHGARLIVNSDAHFHADVGNFTNVLPLLGGQAVPEAVVANVSAERLQAWLKK